MKWRIVSMVVATKKKRFCLPEGCSPVSDCRGDHHSIHTNENAHRGTTVGEKIVQCTWNVVLLVVEVGDIAGAKGTRRDELQLQVQCS